MIYLRNVTKVYKTEGHRRVVLDKVSMNFQAGSSYGLLGVNGAGKSTTMRLMAGTEDPTAGRVVRTVRVSWPLGFSGGFHPLMTGKENVVFIARIYGEDPVKILDFVDDFAELGDYINVPVRTYSSGMQSRLAFGISMAIDFDCYLIDEITAVGDARFQLRCQTALDSRRAHADVIMISHSMSVIQQYCTKGVVLAAGRAIMYDNVLDAIEVYKRLNQ